MSSSIQTPARGAPLSSTSGERATRSFHWPGTPVDRCWSGVSEREPVSIEIPLLCRDGSYRRMMGRGVPRFLEGGVFAGFIGCLTDAGEYVPGKAETAERDQAAYR